MDVQVSVTPEPNRCTIETLYAVTAEAKVDPSLGGLSYQWVDRWFWSGNCAIEWRNQLEGRFCGYPARQLLGQPNREIILRSSGGQNRGFQFGAERPEVAEG